jgi:hypothetical protein
MKTFDAMHAGLNKSGWPCTYWGEHGDWLVAMGRHRDSDILTRCNWAVFIEMLTNLGIDDAFIVENESHWAVGWVEHVLINPNCPEAVALAEKVQDDIDAYPILDECKFSEMEMEEYEQDWASWGRRDLMRHLEEVFQLSDKASDALEEWDGLLDWYTELNGENCLGCVDEIGYETTVIDIASLIWRARKDKHENN